MTIGVRRCGELTSYDLGPVIGEAHIVADGDGLSLRFKDARGFNRGTDKPGHSVYTLWPDSDGFVEIAKAMMRSDPEAAIKAFGAALSEGLPAVKELASKDAA